MDRQKAFNFSLKNHESSRKRYNKNRKESKFQVGDSIYVTHGNHLSRNKLDEICNGLYKIVRRISNVLFKVDSGYQKYELNVYHVSKLYPFTGD